MRDEPVNCRLDGKQSATMVLRASVVFDLFVAVSVHVTTSWPDTAAPFRSSVFVIARFGACTFTARAFDGFAVAR